MPKQPWEKSLDDLIDSSFTEMEKRKRHQERTLANPKAERRLKGTPKRKCAKCKNIKYEDEFYGKAAYCSHCQRAYQRENRAIHRERRAKRSE